jgi:uncharacterized protein (DUF433 family)
MTAETSLELEALPLPLERRPDGSIRFRGSKIPLERIVFLFHEGQSPEEMVCEFPTLKLADVYTAVAFYLNHKEPVDAYAQARQTEEDGVIAELEARSQWSELRDRLERRRVSAIR